MNYSSAVSAGNAIGNAPVSAIQGSQLPPPLAAKQVTYLHGEPTFKFEQAEIDVLVVRQNLKWAVIGKFSHGMPDIEFLRTEIPKQLKLKAYVNIGYLCSRHVLIRCSIKEDYDVLMSINGSFDIKRKNVSHPMRSMKWDIHFDPTKETSIAWAWISFPSLPPNYFEESTLLSFASSVGRPICVDKATLNKSRPSCARVKVEIDLLREHPTQFTIQIVKNGEVITNSYKIEFDFLPKYCTKCCLQGHEVHGCWKLNPTLRPSKEKPTPPLTSKVTPQNPKPPENPKQQNPNTKNPNDWQVVTGKKQRKNMKQTQKQPSNNVGLGVVGNVEATDVEDATGEITDITSDKDAAVGVPADVVTATVAGATADGTPAEAVGTPASATATTSTMLVIDGAAANCPDATDIATTTTVVAVITDFGVVVSPADADGVGADSPVGYATTTAPAGVSAAAPAGVSAAAPAGVSAEAAPAGVSAEAAATAAGEVMAAAWGVIAGPEHGNAAVKAPDASNATVAAPDGAGSALTEAENAEAVTDGVAAVVVTLAEENEDEDEEEEFDSTYEESDTSVDDFEEEEDAYETDEDGEYELQSKEIQRAEKRERVKGASPSNDEFPIEIPAEPIRVSQVLVKKVTTPVITPIVKRPRGRPKKNTVAPATSTIPSRSKIWKTK